MIVSLDYGSLAFTLIDACLASSEAFFFLCVAADKPKAYLWHPEPERIPFRPVSLLSRVGLFLQEGTIIVTLSLCDRNLCVLVIALIPCALLPCVQVSFGAHAFAKIRQSSHRALR